jgi:hypothetical protein
MAFWFTVILNWLFNTCICLFDYIQFFKLLMLTTEWKLTLYLWQHQKLWRFLGFQYLEEGQASHAAKPASRKH